MNFELKILGSEIEKAKYPEDIFGSLQGSTVKDRLVSLGLLYKNLAKRSFPDAFASDKESFDYAGTVFGKLASFKKDAELRIRQEIYGKVNVKTSQTNKTAREDEEVVINNKYVRYASLVCGDIADLHKLKLISDTDLNTILLKLCRNTADNELLLSEQNVLTSIRNGMDKKIKNNVWLTCIPKIHESFLVDLGKDGKARANVVEYFDGFLTASQIRHALPKGVDGRTIAWMWKRLLGLLDWVHKLGYIHGAILPPHVMYFPDNPKNLPKDLRKHSVRLIDWCYSVEIKPGAKLKAWCPSFESFYAPEILSKKTLGPVTDLYMGAKTMVYLLGGDVDSNIFPPSVPVDLAQNFMLCLEKNPSKRPDNLQSYFNSFVKTIEKLYGKPKYHDFVVPTK